MSTNLNSKTLIANWVEEVRVFVPGHPVENLIGLFLW